MVMALVLISIYIVSMIIYYFGMRNAMIIKVLEPDWIIFLVMFIPFFNLIWGLLGLAEGVELKTNFLRRFFKL